MINYRFPIFITGIFYGPASSFSSEMFGDGFVSGLVIGFAACSAFLAGITIMLLNSITSSVIYVLGLTFLFVFGLLIFTGGGGFIGGIAVGFIVGLLILYLGYLNGFCSPKRLKLKHR